MRGQVLGVDNRTGRGVVAGDDGERYTFGPEDWAQKGEPRIGAKVDFETEGKAALSLFPLVTAPVDAHMPAQVVATPAAPTTDRNKIVAALLAFFLGTLGIHRFYLGRTTSGIVMLILSISVIGLLVSGPWALIDAVRYLVMSDEEFAARYPRR
jgi:TM2 domain-containing membrane protein YozV